MRRLAVAALLLASVGGLGGCVFANVSGNDDGKRIKELEMRIARAEKALGIPEESKP
jgi:hypothetical protein